MPSLSLNLGLSALALLFVNGVRAQDEPYFSVSCVDNYSDGKKYTATNGDQYDILCGVDYWGGDIATANGITFEQCIEACNGVTNCVDVSYVPAGGVCYMKDRLNPQQPTDLVWTARKEVAVRTYLSCDAGKDDGSVYTAATGGKYKIVCGQDVDGGDIGYVGGVSFEECMDACDAKAKCKDVAFVNGNCYQKSAIAPLKQAGWVWTGYLIPSPPLSCVSNADDGKLYTTASGHTFEIQCFKDYFGGDIGAASTQSFEECLEVCDTTSGCIDVSYVNGNCYMKNVLNPVQDADWVWGAVLVPEHPDPTSTTTATPTIPNVSATPTGPLSCIDKAFDKTIFRTVANNNYEILCGVDHGGGDFLGVETETFEACLNACDEDARCIDVSYVAPACYMKDTLTAPSEVGHVWNARYIGQASPTITNAPASQTGCAAGGEGLLPAIDADEDKSLLTNLEPASTARLNYAEVAGNRAVSLEFTMIYPQVTLENSALVSDYQCSGEQTTEIVVTFQTSAAYEVAVQWPQTKLVLITNNVASGCNPATSRGVYLVESYTANPADSVIVFQAKTKEFKDVADSMSIKYGVINGNKPTSACTSDLRPVATGTATATITTFAPGTSATLSPGAQEIYDFLKNYVKYDEDGNIIAKMPPQLNQEVAVDEPNFGDDALQADLEKQLQNQGLTPPDKLFKQGKDGVDGVCPVSKQTATRRRRARSSANDLGSLQAWDQRLSTRADGWEIACSDEVGAAAGIFGLDDAVGAVCAGKDIYDSRDAIRCLFTNCQTYYTTTIITYYYPPPSTKYNFEYSWSVKFPTLAGNTIVAQGYDNSIRCVNCGLSVSKVEFVGEIIVNITSGIIQKAQVTTGISQVADLVMNLKSGGAWSGSWSYALSSSDLGPISVDKIFTIVPKMLYGLGVEYNTDTAVDVVGGAQMTLSNANAVIDLLTNTVVSSANWKPTVSFTNPAFVTGSNVLLTPIMRTSINMQINIFGIKLLSPSITSETVVGIDTTYSFTAGVCPAKNLAVNTYVSSKNSLFFGNGGPRDLSTLTQTNKVQCLDVPSSQPAPEDIVALSKDGQAFCTSYLKYTAPTSVQWDTATVTVPSTSIQTATTTVIGTPIVYEQTSYVSSLYHTRTVASSTSYVYTVGTASIEQKYLKRRGEIAPPTPTPAPTATEEPEFEPTVFTSIHDGIFQPDKGLWIPPSPPGPGPVGNASVTVSFSASNFSATALRRRQAVPQPSIVVGWPASKISYACKQVATGTATTTYTATRTSTSGVVVKTVTATANVNGPVSTSTIVSTSSEYWGYKETTTTGVVTVTTASSCPLQTQAACFQLTGHGRPHIEGRLLRYYKDWGMWSFAESVSGTAFYLSCDGTLTMLNEGSRLILAQEQAQVTLGGWVTFVKTDYAEANPSTVQHAKCTRDEVTKKLECELWGLNTMAVSDPYRFVQSWYADPWWPEWQFFPAWGPATTPGGWPLYGQTVYNPIWLTYEDVECPCDFNTSY